MNKLLIRDLLPRLAHGKIKIQHRGGIEYLVALSWDGSYKVERYCDAWFNISSIPFKPYLRTVASMTDPEMDKLFDILGIDKEGNSEDWIKINDVTGIKFFLPTGRWMEEIDDALDYLRELGIDIHDLIGKGLAIENTNTNK